MNESYSAWKEKRGRKSLWNILSDNDNIRKEKEKIVVISLQSLFEYSFCE